MTSSSGCNAIIVFFLTLFSFHCVYENTSQFPHISDISDITMKYVPTWSRRDAITEKIDEPQCVTKLNHILTLAFLDETRYVNTLLMNE